MNEVRKIAQQNANKSPEQNGNEYNKTLHGNHLVIRDRVLLRNFSERERALANCELTGKTQFM